MKSQFIPILIVVLLFIVGCSSEMTDLLLPELSLPIEDDFSDEESGWTTASHDVYTMGYSDGTYRMKANSDALIFSWRRAALEDMILEVDAQRTDGTTKNGFGLICRYRDLDNFYLFQISSEGGYRIGKYVDDVFSEITPWDYHGAINQGFESNSLRVECIGSRLSFFVNGTLLIESNDNDFTTGGFGLLIEAEEASGLEIIFDNFSAKEP